LSRSLVALWLVTVACVAPAAADAQTAGQHLPAIAGVPFGASYASAQARLGPGFKPGTAPREPNIKTLIGRADIDGQTFTANFTFTSTGILNSVFAVTNTAGGDDDACNAHWQAVRASLVTRFGQPVTQSNDPANDLAEAKFAFADGSTVDASELGCLIGVMYETNYK
jgi:hypothetical protein